MAVVVDLDAFRRGFELEQAGEPLQQAALRRTLAETPGERVPRVVQRMPDEVVLGAALRRDDQHTPVGPQRQRLLDERLIGQRMAHEDEGRRRPVVIELADERFQNGLRRLAAAVVGIVRAVAVVAAGAEEEHLHARRTA